MVKSVCRELREQGLTRKPPPRRGLNDRNFYLRHGGDVSVTDGVDFFRGEEAVLEYYATVFLKRKACTPAPARASNPPARAAPTSVCAPGDAHIASVAEGFRLDYLPDIEATEGTLLPLRPTPLVIPAAAVDGESSLADVSREASSAYPTPVRCQAPDPREEDVEVSALCNELLADNNDAEKNGIETGEFDLDEDMEPQCAPDDDHDDPKETDLEITAEVRFGENVLSQFGDKDEDLAGNLKTQVLREISAIAKTLRDVSFDRVTSKV
ncbi:hypothetical protein PF001_g20620 [Phytophthora fragariae]|uniref:Uncharacterized protein n=1 Tax=Phytophthora fragariae TaxID=53985 RepID=A0A6A4CCR6_9STRA|nr:hypothetical protein PF001_g20620 [Phytophthora fragariae]